MYMLLFEVLSVLLLLLLSLLLVVSVPYTDVMLLLMLFHNISSFSSVSQVLCCLDWVLVACFIGKVGIMMESEVDPK